MNVTAVRKIATRFGIQVKASRRIVKGVYRIELSNGKSFALKSMAYPLARLRWIDKALQKVRSAGFTRISWRNPAEAEGRKLYVKFKKGPPYILTPWIQGRWPSPKSQEDMKICGITLANLHRKGTISSLQKSKLSMIGKWPSELYFKHEKLARHIHISRKSRRPNPLHSFLRNHGEEILYYSKRAQSLLQKSRYKQECKKAGQQHHICHGDGGPTNFIFSKDGSYLIDFETLRIDLRAYDLYRVIYNSCKDHEWNFTIAQAILDSYQTEFKLDATDIELIKIWLRFPRTIVTLLNQYYRSSGVKIRSGIAAKLPSALNSERRITAFLKELDQYSNRQLGN